jgi:siroheme synthase-like protein
MPFGFPVYLELAGRRVIVIGAAAVREGKVEGLVAGGADDVVVFAPDVSRRPDRSGDGGARVCFESRPWRPEDLDGAFLCIAASSDPLERAAIAREARARRVLVNVMDDVPNCDFAAPAIVRRGDLAIAIATGGRSPALASRLREALGERFGPEWNRLVDVLATVRDETIPMLPDLGERSRRWRQALDLDEAEQLVADGRDEELRRRLRDRLLGRGAA